jgi:ubiquinone biosynthesis UbiH/UbiF/VisC/COQ6 family hydroxylase
MTESNSPHDVIVVGAGVVGLAASLALAQTGLKVALVAREQRMHSAPQGAFDPRVYAITPKVLTWLESLGVGALFDRSRMQPFSAMQIGAGAAPRAAQLHLSAYESGVDTLATLMEESQLLYALWTAVAVAREVSTIQGTVEGLEQGATSSVVTVSGRRLSARLIVAADGSASPMRALAAIDAQTHDYGQAAVVAHFDSDQSHRGVAWQWFGSDDVLALLPMPGHAVSLVWSQPTERAMQYVQDPTLLDAALAARIAQTGWQLTRTSPPQAYPLRRIHVERLWRGWVVLLGDAAHVVHPLAGQGLNLGLEDVQSLQSVISERERFRDCGDARVLMRHARNRAERVLAMRVLTDRLATLFSPASRLSGPAVAAMNFIGASRVLKSGLIRAALA